MPASIAPLVEIAPLLPARGALIGLDLGTKTIGVAASDPDRRLATGVETVARKTFTADAARLLALAAERKAAGFVLGLPINMDGSEGPRAQSTRAFARNLARLTDHLSHTTAQLDTLLSRINRGEGTLGRLASDTMMYHDLHELSVSLATLLKDLKEHPDKYIKPGLIRVKIP